ncbi:MAG: repair protein RadA [Pseudomonadota bacterium]|jgi:DNA repair protein RadA/Sms
MAKDKLVYLCSACATSHAKWQGQCDGCGAWNTLDGPIQQRQTPPLGSRGRAAGFSTPSGLQPLSEVAAQDLPRWSMGLDEFDRVLGGGMVPGGVVLLGGDPGIGKSTLLLQALASLAQQREGDTLLYISGEESADQIALRARRLGLSEQSLSRIQVLAETQLEPMLDLLQSRAPRLVVIDSIQTLFSEALGSAPGSVPQVRECAAQLTRWAKATGNALFIIGHVTKEGALAGPRVLEHMVDAVLYFEGDAQASFRVVRAVKNRFGTVNELGVFAMTDRGLKAVSNPSALFLSEASLSGHGSGGSRVSGACVLVTQEGSRPLLVEVQALVDQASGGQPRRLSVGLDPQRLAMLLAVLNRHAGISCADQDVFLNVVGGVRVQETAADLALLAAVVSSLRNRPLPEGLVVFGELGLAGEVRPSPRGQERLKEAARLGFSVAMVPEANAPKRPIEGLEVWPVRRLSEALERLFSR